VHYHHMEMRVGSVVNGSLVQQNREPLALSHDKKPSLARKPKPTLSEQENVSGGVATMSKIVD